MGKTCRAVIAALALAASPAAWPRAVAPSDTDSVATSVTTMDGWSLTGDADLDSAGGDLPPGTLMAVDRASNQLWYWKAPEAFCGDQSDALGRTLTYELKLNAVGAGSDDPDVRLTGKAHTLTYAHGEIPGTTWTPFRVPFIASEGWLDESGQGITDEQLKSTLRNLISLEIRGEYRSGRDTGWIRAVSLNRLKLGKLARKRLEALRDVCEGLADMRLRHAELLDNPWMADPARHLARSEVACQALVDDTGRVDHDQLEEFHWGLHQLRAACAGMADYAGGATLSVKRRPASRDLEKLLRDAEELQETANDVSGLESIPSWKLNNKTPTADAQTYGRLMLLRIRRTLFEKPLGQVNGAGERDIHGFTQKALNALEDALLALDVDPQGESPSSAFRRAMRDLKKKLPAARAALEDLASAKSWAKARTDACIALLETMLSELKGTKLRS